MRWVTSAFWIAFIFFGAYGLARALCDVAANLPRY